MNTETLLAIYNFLDCNPNQEQISKLADLARDLGQDDLDCLSASVNGPLYTEISMIQSEKGWY